MKKFIISVMVALMLGSPCYSEIVRKGNNFIKVAPEGKKGKNLVVTKFTYTPNSKKPNEKYQIWINTNNGRCYIKRVSKTTGNEYEQPIDEETSKQVAKAMGIDYNYKPRSKK